MVVEFIGLPGSGKSAYCSRLSKVLIGSSFNDRLFLRSGFYKLKQSFVFFNLLICVFFYLKSVNFSRLWKLSSLMARFVKNENCIFLSDQGIVQCITSVNPKDFQLSLRLLDFVNKRYPYMIPNIVVMVNVDTHIALNRVLLRGDLDNTYFYRESISDLHCMGEAQALFFSLYPYEKVLIDNSTQKDEDDFSKDIFSIVKCLNL